ncbi:helix-turn-helix domain-containing protein [Defluviimonas salinarum]|uniref:Helix-turn-helix domain-containing protein n=1 Tax=Defluviimonas salinarum TaxID=2992147 RepID=A0ABT3JA70_9RHOB|nr:helix-turn-helix domain-containing protein [Defluviimonas salinarum]MCW3784571.1 helix-turn-helix domain-containing protein [Defluviimonas salinarum]
MANEQNTQTTWVNLSSFLNENDLAKRWRKSPRTLQRYRADRTGPAWIRIGGSVLYRLSDVLAFEEAARQEGHSQ